MTEFTEDQITAAAIVKIRRMVPFIPANIMSNMAQQSAEIRKGVLDSMKLRQLVIDAVRLAKCADTLSPIAKAQYDQYLADIEEEKKLCAIKDNLQAKVESGMTLDEALKAQLAERGKMKPDNKAAINKALDTLLDQFEKLMDNRPETAIRTVNMDDPKDMAEAEAEIAKLTAQGYDHMKIMLTPDGIDSFLYELAKVHDAHHAKPTKENKAALDRYYTVVRALEDEIGEQLPSGCMAVTGHKYRITRNGNKFDFFRRREEA